jgi:hypothetical protein
MRQSPALHRIHAIAARLLSFGIAVSSLGLDSATAQADEKSQCVASYERSQVLRRDHRFQRAREELKSCSRVSCPALVRNDCITWLDQVQAAFPPIAIRAVKDGSDVANVKVIEDNEIVAMRLDGASLEVEPGEHNFRFETDGAPPVTLTLVVREREKDRVVPISFVSPHASAAAAAADESIAPRPVPLGVYVLGAVGVVGLGTFAALGVVGKNDQSSLEGSCSPNCAQSSIDKVRTEYIAADVGLGVGAAALISAGVWYLLRPNHSDETPPAPSGVALAPSPGGAVVGWRGVF